MDTLNGDFIGEVAGLEYQVMRAFKYVTYKTLVEKSQSPTWVSFRRYGYPFCDSIKRGPFGNRRYGYLHALKIAALGYSFFILF
jgi:hypothetical protein